MISILKDKKKVFLFYVFFYTLFWIFGLLICFLIDFEVADKYHSVIFGFLFTLPFTLTILLLTVAMYGYFWDECLKFKKITKLKALLLVFFWGRTLFYVLPLFVTCLLYFLQKDHHIFNVFAVFFGIMLSWIVNLITQFIFVRIDSKRLQKERSIRQNVATGDSLKTN